MILDIPSKAGKAGVLDPWNRSRTLFPRDDNGKLLPRAVPILGSVKEEIVMTPLTISELNEIRSKIVLNEFNEKNISTELVKRCMKYPSPEQFELFKPDYRERIKLTILFECGFDIYPDKKSKTKVKQSEKKQLYELFLQDEGFAIQAVFLHELGYNYFNIPKLTKYEIRLILQSKSKIDKKRGPPLT